MKKANKKILEAAGEESEFRDNLLDPEILRTYAGVMNEKVPENKYFERKEK